MAVSSTHPDYADRVDEWLLMRRTHEGEDAVKDATTSYLPMPGGFRANGEQVALEMYAAYRLRARVPDLVAPTVAGMVGVIHRTEIQVEMPDALNSIWERATPDGLTLEAFARRITAELLLTGRYAILVDAGSDGQPLMAGYIAESLLNWSDERDFFVLDESGYERNGYEWREVKRYRVLELQDGRYVARVLDEGGVEFNRVEVHARAGLPMREIPLVVAGARDLSLTPTSPPLLGVGRAVVSHYQLSADYRWQLYMTGQETLFVIGADAPEIVGAGVAHALKGEEGAQIDVKYVGPAGTGIEAHRQAMADEREAAVSAGARLFESQEGRAESGEALRMRYAAQTATLTTVAQTSAQALEKALRYAAMAIGADPALVVVKPNLDFIDTKMTPAEAQALVKVWQDGAISYQTLYENLQRGEVTSAERTHEDELALIDSEGEDFRQRQPGPEESGLIVGIPSGEAA